MSATGAFSNFHLVNSSFSFGLDSLKNTGKTLHGVHTGENMVVRIKILQKIPSYLLFV